MDGAKGVDVWIDCQEGTKNTSSREDTGKFN